MRRLTAPKRLVAGTVRAFFSSNSQIVERIRNQLPSGASGEVEIMEESALTDLGVNSLHLITALLELQREYGPSDDWFAQVCMPSTVGELVTLVERGLSNDR